MKHLSDYKEVETKYSVDGKDLFAFKQLVSSFPGLKQFVYVESDDIYYKNEAGEFLRYRAPDQPEPGSKCELTKKSKTDSRNNIFRLEVNLNVADNSKSTVSAFVESIGYTYNFKIRKSAHIYIFADATLPFYTVTDEDGNIAHFVEIEVDEELASTLSTENCWEIIKKYERLLTPFGIKPQSRLKKSLLEMYQKE